MSHPTASATRSDPVDCLILGGGPAGLSAAVYLGRLRRSTLVVDDRAGRSLWSQVNRNYLGFPDGVEAAELRRLGREQAARYGTRFLEGSATSLRQEDGLFCAALGPRAVEPTGTGDNLAREEAAATRSGEEDVTQEREVWASTVILATGVRDHFPVFPGRDECVGKTLFWCIICDGYEALGKHVVVVGGDEEAVSTALQLRQISEQVSIVAGAPSFEVDDARLEDLAAAGVAAFATNVAEWPNAEGCISALLLEDGTRLPLDLVFVIGPSEPRSDLARELGVELSRQGYVVSDPEQLTNVPGFYAAGDVTKAHNHQITSAVHEGGMAAAAANYELYGKLQKPQE